MKYILITGASSGIGYETAMAFARLGKNLILVARRKGKLEELRTKIKLINPNLKVLIKVKDLSITENVYNLYEEVRSLELEALINNAGFGDVNPVSEVNLDKIEKMLHLNIEALTILSTLFVHDYKDVEGTQLINVASIGGRFLYINNVIYCATKFYVIAFTEGLAYELKVQGAKMQAKVLDPAATESEFARKSLNFDYNGDIPAIHTSKEMAEFMLELYSSEKVVGIIDKSKNEFVLTAPMFPISSLEDKPSL